MEVPIEDFFKPLKLKSPPTDSDYRRTEWYLQAADAFARTAHQCVYIIDYYKKGFLFVSDNPLFLCGETVKNVLKMGYQFYQKHVPASDLAMLLQINEEGFDFYYKLPASDRLNYTISYDFHLVQPSKRLILINHKLTPLVLDGDDSIWLALCVVTHSSNKEAGNVIITKKGNNKAYEYNLATKEWIVQKRTKLTRQEKDTLTLTIQGFTADQIAFKMKITEATVKFHKRNIFKKLQVKNIAEAISYATNFNLF
jgi:DNA-binding CsgD family transcriptional regulator